jgi:hypothetical protein
MPSALGVAGDVTGAATALAGLILVFLGAISTSFDSYQKTEQSAVRGRYQRRAWFAFIGFSLAILAALLALLAQWFSQACLALTAVALLAVAMIWTILAALSSVREIK